jgi:uncharacterized protein (TIGR03382 family)
LSAETRFLTAIGVGVVKCSEFWAIFRGVSLWGIRQLQKEVRAGLAAVSDGWSGPAAMVGFVLGFTWQVRRRRIVPYDRRLIDEAVTVA